VQRAKGTIDVEMAEDFLADHFDSFEKKAQADERSLVRARGCLRREA